MHIPILLLLLLLALTSKATEVGYGPLFDPCGDLCQTQLRIFCTENRNAFQQKQCWCGGGEYQNLADACLQSCVAGAQEFAIQRGVMRRFREVVCSAGFGADDGFREYYRTRYDGTFVPNPTKQAPPALVSGTTSAPAGLTRTMRTSTRQPATSTHSSNHTTSTAHKDPASSPTTSPPTTSPTSSPSTPLPSTTSPSPTNSITAESSTHSGLNNYQIGYISIASTLGLIALILPIILFRRRLHNLWCKFTKTPPPLPLTTDEIFPPPPPPVPSVKTTTPVSPLSIYTFPISGRRTSDISPISPRGTNHGFSPRPYSTRSQGEIRMVDPSPPNSFGLGRGRVDVAAGMSWARPRVQGPQSNAMDEVEEGDSMEDERLCDIERESGAVRRLV